MSKIADEIIREYKMKQYYKKLKKCTENIKNKESETKHLKIGR